MSKSLKTLSRIQKFNIDEQRKKLSEKMEEEAQVIENIKQLDAKYEEEKRFATQNPGVGDFGLFTKRYLKIRRGEEEHLRCVKAEIEAIRDKISEMFKEQKTFEIVDKHREAAERYENEQKEQKMLDEIGTNAYIKQHGDNT